MGEIEKLPKSSAKQEVEGKKSSVAERGDSVSITRAAGRGVIWQFIGAGWQTIIQLGASMVLARVLLPEDFGLMGMALLAQGLVKRMADMSPVSGVIAKPDATQADLSTAFWISMTLQSLLFLVTFSLAPLAALFFEEPKVTAVIRLLSVTFLFVGIRAIHGAQLRKQLKFGLLKIIEGYCFAFQSGLAIVLVLVFKMGYWALVIPIVASGFLETCSIMLCQRWMPSFVFSKSSFRYMFRYSISSLGTSIIGYFRHNIDYLLVGKLLGPAALGLYEFAYRIPHIAFNRLGIPVSRVIFPALANVQASNDRLTAGYIKTARYLAIILFPALGGLAAVAEPAVTILWGEKWISVIVPLQILCFRSMILSIVYPVSSIFLCKGRPEVPLYNDIFGLVFTIVVVVGLGYAYGIIGVALGMLISVASQVVLLWLAFRLTEAPLRRLFLALIPPTVSATISSACATGAVYFSTLWGGGNLVVLIMGILTGAVTYFVVMWFGYPGTTREVFETFHTTVGGRRRQDPTSQGSHTVAPEKQPVV